MNLGLLGYEKGELKGEKFIYSNGTQKKHS